MFKAPSVSIIVVNFNGENFICDCIDSILKTDYPKYEIIIIENSSTDKSLQLLRNRYSKNAKIRIKISNKNLYFTGGSNLGAKFANGEYLVFINSDTTVTSKWLTKLISLATGKRKALIQPKIYVNGSKKIIDSVGGKYLFNGFGIGIGRMKDMGQYGQDVEVDYVNGTCFMIERKFFNELGGFDDWYRYHYEDVDLCLKAKRHGGLCFFCHDSVIYHKVSLTFKKNVDSTTFKFNVRKNCIQTVFKNFAGLNRALRLTSLLSTYFIWSLKDILYLNTTNLSITFKAIIAVYRHNYPLGQQFSKEI